VAAHNEARRGRSWPVEATRQPTQTAARAGPAAETPVVEHKGLPGASGVWSFFELGRPQFTKPGNFSSCRTIARR
jgi:hypothetical protein